MNTREREVMAAARALAIRYQQPGEDVVARFERVAEMFRRETGFMAPGKDEPAAAYAGEESARERDDAWNAWSRKPVDDLIASLAAYDALLAEGSASSEGVEVVAPYVPEDQWSELLSPQPAQGDCECHAETSYADGIDHTVMHRCAKHAHGEQEQRSREGSELPTLVEEGLTYFAKAGDDGDKLYIKAIREHIAALEQRTSERRPIADEVAEPPYFVEVDKNGCAACGHERSWTVVGPGDVAEGQSWLDEEEADRLCERMNAAYYAGRESALPRGLPAVGDAPIMPSERTDNSADLQSAEKQLEPIGLAVVDFIADEHRNAAGGIYGTRVQDFAYEIQRQFAEKNGLHLRGIDAAIATAEQPSCGQDARDAARNAIIDMAREVREKFGGIVDAAIAAQQRQGGEK